MAIVTRYRVYGVEQVIPHGGYQERLWGQWKVGYRNLHPHTGAPWQSYKTKYFATSAAAWDWVRAHSDGLGMARRKPAGQARSRGGLSIPQERERRVVDARLQPRTPVTRQRFFFKPFHRPPPPRRRPLDEETRREYEQRYIDLGYGLEGAAHAISRLRGEIDSDVYDRGNYVDYRHHAKGKKAFTPTGRRVTHRPEVGFDTAIKAAKARLRELTADYRAQKRELAEINDVLKYGEKPGHYRKRLARTRARRRGR